MKRYSFYFARMVVLSGILLMMGIVGCSKDSGSSNPVTTPSADSNAVTMQNTAFNPATLTVSAGTTVTWTNKDNMNHTVTSGTPTAPDGLFDSGNLGNGGTFHFTFGNKGTFQYFCRVHANTMKGTIIVQ